MGRNKQRIYSLREWEAADPLDRLYIHLLEPERWNLNPKEEEMLDRLRKVWAIVCEKSTQRARIKLISEQIEVSERTVQRYINDSIRLFGDILRVDMDLELSLAYERYMKLYSKAVKAEDFDTARRCQDSATAILDKIEARQPKQQKVYAELIFTSDPAAIKARNSEELEFEDLPDAEESLLEREATELPAGH